MRGLCTVLMCAVQPGISGTLNASRDSSQPFGVGKSGVGGISSGAASGVFRNENDQISPAVVAGVGVDAVDCSTQVRVSTISSFSLPGVFCLRVVRQYSPCG